MSEQDLIDTIGEIDSMLDKLYDKRVRKDELRAERLQTELANINRETNAYCDGAFDMAKKIKEALGGGGISYEKTKSAISQV